MVYTQAQWIIVFFTYCVLGWVWESCFVSVQEHRWVNRGFLYGPYLPIYGSGAVIILFAVWWVQEYPALIFLVGMASATTLEYITGVVMERIFHMRYWDYSKKRFNVNGYICLSASLGWGCFSCLLIKVFHPPIREAALGVPDAEADILSLLFTVVFVIDVTKSVQAALETRGLLSRITDSKMLMEEASARLKALAPQLAGYSEQLKARVTELESVIAERRHAVQRDSKYKLLTMLKEKAELVLHEVSIQLQKAETSIERERLSGSAEGLADFRSLIRRVELELSARRDKEVQKAISILNRNPSAVSRRYKEAFAELLHLKGEARRK